MYWTDAKRADLVESGRFAISGMPDTVAPLSP
jgi:hypothetical protein